MTTEKNCAEEAADDALECAESFEDTLIQMWRDDRTLSTDLLNDYPDGDSYHHENHTDREYSLRDASEILDRLSDFEETDSGLWQGLAPREAISAQAAYTYANAVYSEWVSIVEALQEDLEGLESALQENPPHFEEGKEDEYDEEEYVSDAGARYLRLYFVLARHDDSDFGGMVGAAREAAKLGEWGAARALADAVQESGEPYTESKAQRIRDAVK